MLTSHMTMLLGKAVAWACSGHGNAQGDHGTKKSPWSENRELKVKK